MTSYRLFELGPQVHDQGHRVDNPLLVCLPLGPLLTLTRYHPLVVVCFILCRLYQIVRILFELSGLVVMLVEPQSVV